MFGRQRASPSDALDACAEGNGLTVKPDRTVRGRILNARWAQDGNKLHLVGSMPSGVNDKTAVITVADTVACSYRGDQQGSFRRCSREEMQVSEPINSLDGFVVIANQ